MIKKMIRMKIFLLVAFSALYITVCHGQNNRQLAISDDQQKKGKEQLIIPAAERINVYLPLIKGKRIGIFANQTSTVGNSHWVLISRLFLDPNMVSGEQQMREKKSAIIPTKRRVSR